MPTLNARLPTRGLPKVTTRRSARGKRCASHSAASCATAPPSEWPMHTMPSGARPCPSDNMTCRAAGSPSRGFGVQRR